MGIQKKSIALYILLSIVTCGVFGWYWMYTLTEDINKITGNKDDFSGGIAVLLNIVTCGIFGIYWAYKQGEKLDKYLAGKDGIVTSDTENLSILYLVLACLNYFTGFTVLIVRALIQDNLNRLNEENSNTTI